jgi:hypothetical protein
VRISSWIMLLLGGNVGGLREERNGYLCEDFFFFEFAELGHCALEVEAGFVCYGGHVGRS